MNKLLEELVPIRETKPRKTASKKGRKWSKEQHEKFAKTMKAVWKRKRAANG